MNNQQITSAITCTIKGVPYKGIIPKVGSGWGKSVGSDFYGGEITEVAEDLTWFKTDKEGYAKFDHRKNSIHYGKYVFAYPAENGKLKYEKTNHNFRCTRMNVCSVYEIPQSDRLDPHF